jgi:hypothetical protein
MSGRLHLDRRLPFLVVHRQAAEDSAGSIARRVAVNNPAYLVWTAGPDDEEALRRLAQLIEELGEPEMPLLVIAVEDLDQIPASDDSERLTPFVATLAGGGSDRELRARKALTKAMSAIEVDLRRPELIERQMPSEHWLVRSLGDRPTLNDLMLIGLPQVHRRGDGGIYPQLAHELTVACGDSLLQTACAYLDDGRADAPVHYRALGRSAFLKAALNADRKLAAIAGSFDFLLSVSPINASEALQRFIADREEKAPDLRYRPLAVDPDATKRGLYRLDFTRLEDPLLERLFTEKRHEIDAQLTMLATRNTPSFRPASLFLYGAVSAGLLDDARGLLATLPRRVARAEAVGAPVVAAAARALIASYSCKDTPFAATVEIRDDVSGLMVTGNRLLIGSTSTMPAARLDALLSHEVSTHLLTYLNGSQQGLSIFRTPHHRTGTACRQKSRRLHQARQSGPTRGEANCSLQAPSHPDNPADDVDVVRVAIVPAGISDIVAPDGEAPAGRAGGQALHHQRAFHSEHVDAVAQAVGGVAAIEQDIIAIGERREHRIPIDPDDRQLLGIARYSPEPGSVER